MSDKKGQLEKSYFQQFIEANEALIDCYERAHNKDPKGDAAILATCTQHREKIETILRNDYLSMTILVQQRLPILQSLAKKNPPVPIEPSVY